MIQYSVVLPISFLAVVELSYVCMYGAYSYRYFWESIKGVKLNRPILVDIFVQDLEYCLEYEINKTFRWLLDPP